MDIYRLLAFALLLMLWHSAAAATELSQQKEYNASRVSFTSSAGLTVSLPSVSVGNLYLQASNLRSHLQIQKADLSQKAKAREFGIKDGLLTIIMPGGLLYAATKFQLRRQALAELDSVTVEIKELDEDLTLLASRALGDTLLATID